MANLDSTFRKFNDRIKLTDSKREDLRNARDVLREKVTDYFKEGKPDYDLDFKAQGSYVMDTIVNPINDDYDLDDGAYFLGTLSSDERPAPSTFHSWMIDAIGNHTGSVQDKNTCIRVNYAKGFHIDIPIYYSSFYEPELAHKAKGWILSNPIEFIIWFEEKTKSGFKMEYLFEADQQDNYIQWHEDMRKDDVQLRRIVRYLKAWGDFKGDQMPSGIIMTILAGNNYHPDQRDDISFLQTLINIHTALSIEFVCRRPTTPAGEDLFSEYSDTRKKLFMNELNQIILAGDQANKGTDQSQSCKNWKNHFGDRFPCHLLGEDNSKIYEPLKTTAISSNPWAR